MSVSMDCVESAAGCGYLEEEVGVELGEMGDGRSVSQINKKEAEEGLEENIFVPNETRLKNLAALNLMIRKLEGEKVFRSYSKVMGNKANAGGEVSASFSFGGGEEPKFNVNITGSIGDQKGNQGNLSINVDEKGRATVTASASKKDKN